MNHLDGGFGPMFGVLVSMLNVGLLIALLVLFGQAYRRMKTPFGLGLLVFVVVLLIQNVAQVLLALARAGRQAGGGVLRPGLLTTGVDLLELVALVILLYLATR